MSIHKNYAVFGLGRYGRAVAAALAQDGAEVLGVDRNLSIINEAVDEIPVCKCGDVTDPEVLEQLGIANVDTVVVAMASNLEASVLAVTLCKELGVPRVIVKCGSEMHRKILERVGADRVIIPEKESGIRLAKNLLSAGFSEMMELSGEVSMVELAVRPEWVGKNLVELSLRRKYAVNVVALREGEKIYTEIDPTAPLAAGMKLIVIANPAKLHKLR